MVRHVRLTLREREDVMMMRRDGESVFGIARAIGCHKSTVSRELAHNEYYRASSAQQRYEGRRLACTGGARSTAASAGERRGRGSGAGAARQIRCLARDI